MPSGTRFSIDSLAENLKQLGVGMGAHVHVAYSGGMDSHVLLHALSELRESMGFNLMAQHINHGVNPQSGSWATHCQSQCDQLAVDCQVHSITLRPGARGGLEAVARQARYACLEKILESGDIVVTAHHLDDQAETVLIMLLRGSGVPGLAAMPQRCSFGVGLLLRPLLGCSRRALWDYAQAHGLRWIEDSSNQNIDFTRNFIRHRIFPVIQERWPQVAQVLTRSASHCAEATQLLNELAGGDLALCRGGYSGLLRPTAPVLSIKAVTGLVRPRQKNLVRYWCRCAVGLAPHAVLLDETLQAVIGHGESGCAVVRWQGHAIRRYRDCLVIVPDFDLPGVEQQIRWDLRGPMVMKVLGLRLTKVDRSGMGIDPRHLPTEGVSLRWRQGGEICHLPGREGGRTLKKLYQERGIPPWERQQIPLIYIGEILAGVAGLWTCRDFAAAPDRRGVVIAVESC
ncbi:MAG TPA: tRNA lysidine(34) synthetase TilS [Acidiferrobacteraceae bacterium]|nr:tRNA lysidine(34) synthetase TilS [Acidiferrobacteraceae bacterium]